MISTGTGERPQSMAGMPASSISPTPMQRPTGGAAAPQVMPYGPPMGNTVGPIGGMARPARGAFPAQAPFNPAQNFVGQPAMPTQTQPVTPSQATTGGAASTAPPLGNTVGPSTFGRMQRTPYGGGTGGQYGGWGGYGNQIMPQIMWQMMASRYGQPWGMPTGGFGGGGYGSPFSSGFGNPYGTPYGMPYGLGNTIGMPPTLPQRQTTQPAGQMSIY